ncbi:MAG TPA: YHS domain-containing protein [Ferruginibacter sp.]|nr:YHS domain-containing protein [Ferruginibacter sp.]
MYKKIIAATLFAQILISCAQNTEQKEETLPAANADTMPVKAEPLFKNLVYDSKKDLVCGMPVTAGVSDTAHYEGKLYGFCAKECKDEFLKDPKHYLTIK